jgi:hypothetical protein
MTEILSVYGYRVRTDAGDREQNFSCDLHGDGRDGRPSAIFYPRTNSAHCFACSRSRDAITWVMEKEGTDFWSAVQKIEADYSLPPLPWEDDTPEDNPTAPLRPRGATSEVEAVLAHTESYDAAEARVRRYLEALCAERSLPPVRVYALWEACDKVRHLAAEGLSERDAVALMHRVLDKAKALAVGGLGEGAAG